MLAIKVEKNIINTIEKIIKDQFDLDFSPNIEKPNEISNGSYATNIAMQLASKLKRNPREIATIITDNFVKNDYIDKLEVAGPGFINFYMTQQFYNSTLMSIDQSYGTWEINSQKKYLVEYVSANPTGDLHLGHARGGAYGDALIRIMKKAGYDVTSEYYINDAGSQMNNLGLSVKYFYLKLLNVDIDFPTDGYRGEDIKAIASSLFEKFEASKQEQSIDFFIDYAYAYNLEEIKKILNRLNISFDNWVSEKQLYEQKKVENALSKLEQSGDLYENDGALWLKTSKYLDEKDRTIRKSDGSFTYFAADIAYHIDKYERGYTNLIDIWGADHHGYVPRVKSSIQSLGQNPNTFEVPLIQMVSILNDGDTVKMSKRAGTSVTIKDLLKEVEPDALRYFFVMRSPDTQFDFDIKIATEQSMNNPMYYIQYANARISSILTEAEKTNINCATKISNLTEDETKIIDHLSIYPKVIKEAAQKRMPHIICNYLYDLASLFHKYYNQERVFGNAENIVEEKLLIYSRIKLVLVSGLNVLGIQAQDKM